MKFKLHAMERTEIDRGVKNLSVVALPATSIK